MKNYLLVSLLLTSISTMALSSLSEENHSKITYIKNSDFCEGSYIIMTPGTYILTEDIIFDPPEEIPLELMMKNPAFHLGFFGAIIIQTNNVTIDLNGYEIRQSPKHYLNQRFYSHIELGSSPFLQGVGPHDFTTNYISVKNVVIKNGTLGLSSHHGIHGNNSEDVNIQNLKIKHFEVAAIAINGGKNILVENIVVGPISNKVAVNGSFSAARQIIGYIEALEIGGQICDPNPLFITIRGINKTAKTIRSELMESIRQTEEAFLSAQYQNINQFYRNPSMHPDGGVVYGILFHTENAAVGPFNTNFINNFKSTKITLKNIIIKGLEINFNERVSLQVDEGEILKTAPPKAQKDARGSIFNVFAYTDSFGGYISNPLGNAQLMVTKYKKCLFDQAKEFQKMNLFHTNTKRNNISQKVVEWAANPIATKLVSNYICNGDDMQHAVKGLIPLRLSGSSFLDIENLKIENMTNKSSFGSKVCGNYRNSISNNNSLPGFLGADIRGITIESCNEITLKNVKIENLNSLSGSVIGVDVLFGSQAIKGDITTSRLTTIDWKNLPIDFNDIPQNIPIAVPAMKSSISTSLLNVQINDLNNGKIVKDSEDKEVREKTYFKIKESSERKIVQPQHNKNKNALHYHSPLPRTNHIKTLKKRSFHHYRNNNDSYSE